MQTGPWGVFSPEAAICTCLFGMQWALPPIPWNLFPLICLWLYLPPLNMCVCVYLYIRVIIFDLSVHACCFCLCLSVWVHIFQVCVSACVCTTQTCVVLIRQCRETSCYAQQWACLKSIICLPSKCVNLLGSIISWKWYGGMHVQLNNRLGLFCYALCINCGVFSVLGSMFVYMCECFGDMQWEHHFKTAMNWENGSAVFFN